MSADPVLETERLVLTGWTADQLDDLARLHGDPEIARYLKTGLPWTREQVEEALSSWIALFAAHRMGKLRAIRKVDGVLVGRAGFGIYPPTGEPELGYALFREYWGHGYAFEAAVGLRGWLFRETDWSRFIGFADTRNTASIRVLRAIGMQPTHIGRGADGFECAFHVYRREDWHG